MFPGHDLEVAVDQGTLQPLMVPLVMVVRHVFADRASTMGFTRRYYPVKALALDRKHKSLCKSVQVRKVFGQPHCLDTRLVADLLGCFRVQGDAMLVTAISPFLPTALPSAVSRRRSASMSRTRSAPRLYRKSRFSAFRCSTCSCRA
jgi:hypothetical protein